MCIVRYYRRETIVIFRFMLDPGHTHTPSMLPPLALMWTLQKSVLDNLEH